MPLSPEWAKLPKRRCDDCGKLYKPVKPRREGEMGFCSDNCRKSYHKHGGAYRKLKAEMVKLVERHMKEIRKELIGAAAIEVSYQIQRLNGHSPAISVSPLPNPQSPR